MSDCIENFNEVAGSMKLNDTLNSMINQQDITVLGIIHENPFTDKARGHLGTELINKASVVLQISEEQSLIKLKFLHTRNTKRPADIYLKYSEEKNGLILANSDEIPQKSERMTVEGKQNAIAQRLFYMIPEEGIKIKELISKLHDEFDFSDKTLITRLEEIINLKIPVALDGSEKYLFKKNSGREIIYYISEKEENDEIGF